MASTDDKQGSKKKDADTADDGVTVFRFDTKGAETVSLDTPGLKVRTAKRSKEDFDEAERKFTDFPY